MIVCPLLGNALGTVPDCYSRNIDINNTIIFQPATCIIHISAIIITAIIIWHVRIKYTAVGRQEILFLFWLYGISELLVLFLDSAVIPTYSGAYSWFTAIYVGLKTAIFWSLMLNGFVGFQFFEDGTPASVWLMRISSFIFFFVSFIVAAATFEGFGGSLSPEKSKQGGLWFFEIAFPIVMVAIYIVSQVILVLRTLNDLWPIADITFGVLAFLAGVIISYGFSNQICSKVSHYIDGTFFAALCMLLAIMMVYKYWDSITMEDLEFSVGSKHAVWDTKEPLLHSDMDSSQTHDGLYMRSPASAKPPMGSMGSLSVPPSPPQKNASSYNLAPSMRSSLDAGPAYPPHH